ncbi:hypothetical protein V3C99_012901 [Haemonchus contortus]
MAFSDHMSDASNFFNFMVLQVLHGPVDLKFPSTQNNVTFCTSGKKNRGIMKLQLYTSSGEKNIIEIPLVHVENIMIFTHPQHPSIALHLSEFAARSLAINLGTREKIEHINHGFGDASDTSIRKLLFVLRPFKDDLFVQVGSTEEPYYGGIDELCERFDSWVRCIRDKDLLAKEQRLAEKSCCSSIVSNSSRFFVRSTGPEWVTLLQSVHLFVNRDKDADAVPYICRPPEPRPTNAPRLKVPKLFNRQQHPSSIETDAVLMSSRNASQNQQSAYENGNTANTNVMDPSSNARGDMNMARRASDHHYPVQIGVVKQNASHVVPMQGRNFAPSSNVPRSFSESHPPVTAPQQNVAVTTQPTQWQIVQPGTILQVQLAQPQGTSVTPVHASPLRAQQVVVQSQQPSPVVYQVASIGQQHLMKQTTTGSNKIDGSRLLFVNNASPSRVPILAATPQATVAAVKRPSRTSARLKKEVETIALDDDDETNVANTSSSAGNCDGDENGSSDGVNGEPSEKRPRLDDPIKDEVLLVFPPGESGAITLHFEDLRVLAHGEMLNDNIIEFYLKYIRAKLVEKEQRDKVFVFNTFFYQKLTEKQPSISILNKNHRSSVGRFEWIKRNFSKVKSWTKKVDIFNMDYIVLPINDEMHWYLVIIVKPALAVVTQRTEDVEQARKRGSFRADPDTFIVVLDSLPDPNDVKRKCVLDILRDYLECELADKRGIHGEVYLDRTRIGALYPQGVPHQENYVDCGLYLLQFAEAFLTKPPLGKMLRQGARWKEWYPWFDHSMYFMRDKISRRLQGLCNKKAWQRLVAYEHQQGRGVNVETSAVAIEKARRPRRHSETRLHEPHPRARKRTHSEPPNIKKCAPPAPRMVP